MSKSYDIDHEAEHAKRVLPDLLASIKELRSLVDYTRQYERRNISAEQMRGIDKAYERSTAAIARATQDQGDQEPCNNFRSDGRGCCVNCGHFHGKTEG